MHQRLLPPQTWRSQIWLLHLQLRHLRQQLGQ
nr:MAG TPA: hypothetical protein [Bacteriophage sp.]